MPIPCPRQRPPAPSTSQLHLANLCCLSHLVCWYTKIHSIPFYFCAVGRNVPSIFFFKQEPLTSKLFVYLLLAVLGSRCARGLSLVAVGGGTVSGCAGFCWSILLQIAGPRAYGLQESWLPSSALELRPTGGGPRAQLLYGAWDPPGPGAQPASCIGRQIRHDSVTREAPPLSFPTLVTGSFSIFFWSISLAGCRFC